MGSGARLDSDVAGAADQVPLAEVEEGSDDDSTPAKSAKKNRFNLLGYNRQRRDKLNEFDFQTNLETEEEEDDQDSKISQANRLKLNCWQNLEISLFWEEKIFMMVRVVQLYSCLFFFYYEQWPSSTRKYMTVLFSAMTGSLYIKNQDEFYEFEMSFDLVKYVVFSTIALNLILVVIGLVLTWKRTLRYRLEFATNSRCNVYRFYFWLMEVLYVPLLLNVSWPAACKFWSEREAIQLTDCNKEEDPVMYWVVKGMLCLAYLLNILYNSQLFAYILRNKISSASHEQSIIKKEVEYVYGINKIWSTEKFFTFSSFRGGISGIYHRIVFNLFCSTFIAVNAAQVSQLRPSQGPLWFGGP